MSLFLVRIKTLPYYRAISSSNSNKIQKLKIEILKIEI